MPRRHVPELQSSSSPQRFAMFEKMGVGVPPRGPLNGVWSGASISAQGEGFFTVEVRVLGYARTALALVP